MAVGDSIIKAAAITIAPCCCVLYCTPDILLAVHVQVDYIPVTTGNLELPAATKTLKSSASTAGFSLMASAVLLLVSFVLFL